MQLNKDGIIFVFGSNQAGIHGAGAAADALKYWGAIWGRGNSFQGRSYAIPTKDRKLNPLPLSMIDNYVAEFLLDSCLYPNLDFQVTRIGCGLAGYTDKDIAPMFRGAPPFVHLPLGWRELAKQ